MADHLLDVRGLDCPLPVLKTKTVLEDVAAGDTLEVLATDPGSIADFPAFCRITGNVLVAQSEAGGVYRFVIRKAA